MGGRARRRRSGFRRQRPISRRVVWRPRSTSPASCSPTSSTACAPARARRAERVERGTLAGAGRIGEAVGQVINKYKVGKHFERTITDTSFSYQRDHAGIAAEAALDGIYVLGTSVPSAELDAAGVVAGYKNLAHLERDFRSIKTDDLDLRPIHHRLTERVNAHVLICLLACYLTWHLRKAWAPLTFTDENPPTRDNPVKPAQRSGAAQAKASRQQTPDGSTLRSFRALLHHLATLTRNEVTFTHTPAPIPMLAAPSPDQRRAFELLGATIPLTIAAWPEPPTYQTRKTAGQHRRIDVQRPDQQHDYRCADAPPAELRAGAFPGATREHRVRLQPHLGRDQA